MVESGSMASQQIGNPPNCASVKPKAHIFKAIDHPQSLRAVGVASPDCEEEKNDRIPKSIHGVCQMASHCQSVLLLAGKQVATFIIAADIAAISRNYLYILSTQAGLHPSVPNSIARCHQGSRIPTHPAADPTAHTLGAPPLRASQSIRFTG